MSMEKGETGLRYLREIAALLIAGLILAGFLLMMNDIYINVDKDIYLKERKDLLQIFTGFLGIVIGYYFNRISTEARAEKAESAAQRANETAQGVITEHTAAKSELRNVIRAARNVLKTSDRPQTRAAVSGTNDVENELKRLQDAVEQAEKIL